MGTNALLVARNIMSNDETALCVLHEPMTRSIGAIETPDAHPCIRQTSYPTMCRASSLMVMTEYVQTPPSSLEAVRVLGQSAGTTVAAAQAPRSQDQLSRPTHEAPRLEAKSDPRRIVLVSLRMPHK